MFVYMLMMSKFSTIVIVSLGLKHSELLPDLCLGIKGLLLGVFRRPHDTRDWTEISHMQSKQFNPCIISANVINNLFQALRTILERYSQDSLTFSKDFRGQNYFQNYVKLLFAFYSFSASNSLPDCLLLSQT